MTLKPYLLAIFCILFNVNSFGQGIKGKVMNQGVSIPDALVYLKSTDSLKTLIKYTETDKSGNFKIEVTHRKNYLLEVRSLEYEFYSATITPVEIEKPLEIELIPKAFELKEVIITQKPATAEKKDTVIFNTDKFRDGSEKNIQDILKKLPGVSVAKDGQIQYKGKSIKKLLFDGDDLFSTSYTTGTRNIDANMVESVEAYSNYNEYQALKGISNNEDDVALNVKLKKGRGAISGSIRGGGGFNDRWNNQLGLMYVSNAAKIFNTTGYNNINEEMSPENLTSVDLPKVITEDQIYPPIETESAEEKKRFFSSTNALVKFSRKTSVRMEAAVSSIRQFRRNENETIYNFPEENVQIVSNQDIVASPKKLLISSDFKTGYGKKGQLEYFGKLGSDINAFTSLTDNNGLFQENQLRSRQNFHQHEIRMVSTVTDSIGYHASATYSDGSAPQDYHLLPGLLGDPEVDFQYSQMRKREISSKWKFMGTYSPWKWSVEPGYRNTRFGFKSDLQAQVISAQNDLTFSASKPYASGALLYRRKKFSFGVSLTAEYLNLQLKDRDTAGQQLQRFVLNPGARISWIFRKVMIMTRYDLVNQHPFLENFYRDYVLTNFRTLNSNESQLEIIPMHTAEIQFSGGSALYLPMWRLTFSWRKTEKNFFTRNNISEVLNLTSSVLFDQPATNWSASYFMQHYFRPLKLTFETNLRYSINDSRTNLNDSGFLKSRNQSTECNLIIRTPSRLKLYCENSFTYAYSLSSLEGSADNDFSNFEDELRLVYKPIDNFRTIVSGQFFHPDLSKGQNYLFLNAGVEYGYQQFEWSLQARNLMDNRKFTLSHVSPISSSSSSFNLMPAYVLASMSYRFQ